MTERFVGILAVALFFIAVSFATVPAAGKNSGGDEGRMLYGQKCGNCHGKKGEGFRRVYPPIRNSRYLTNKLPHLPCIIRHGLRGKITVADRVFNQAMPGDPRITSEEIALIIGFMQEEWRHPSTVLEVDKWLENCGTHVIDDNRLLADEVMAVHDEAMAKMGYMHELRLALKKQGESAASKEKSAAAIASLRKAHKAMMEWMRNYRPPKTDAELSRAEDYLQEEKVKITEVGRLIDESIEQAEKLRPLE